jgi:CBS domain containing-hemolysin-like protein
MSAGNGAGASAGESLISADNFAGPIVPSEEPAITEEELSGLDQRDRAMLRSIIDLDYTTVREVMVPRLDMVALEGGVSLKEAADAIIEYGHSRLPVYNETIDYVLGIVYVRDLLAAVVNPQEDRDLRSLIRPAFIVPETKRVDELLEEFRQRRTQIAIVVDEYGGTEGLVTMEDVLEEIVGEIEDEFSKEKGPIVTPTADGGLIVDAGLSLNDLEELVDARFDEAEVDTIGGIVYSILDKMPKPGDEVVYEGLRIKVLTTMGRRLRKLLLAVDPQTQS